MKWDVKIKYPNRTRTSSEDKYVREMGGWDKENLYGVGMRITIPLPNLSTGKLANHLLS